MARSFTAASSHYLSATIPSLAPPFTIACFAIRTVANSSTMISLGETGVSEGHILYNSLTVGIAVASGVGGSSAQAAAGSGQNMSNTVYSHAAGVFASDASRSVYLDGVFQNSDTTNIPTSGLNRIEVGVQYYNGIITGQYWTGSICEVGLWNVALTASEIRSLADGVSPAFIRPTGLVGYWPLHARSTGDENWFGTGAMSNPNSAPAAAHARVVMPASLAQRIYIPSAAPAAGRPFIFCMT